MKKNTPRFINPIKTVIVGLGNMGLNHLRVILQNTDFEITALVDSAFPNVALPADAYKIPHFNSIAGIKNVPCSLCIVATPTHTHGDIACKLFALGKDVFLEKPLAHSHKDCKNILAASKKYNKRIFVGHVERFNPAVLKLKDVLSAGLIGSPIHFSSTRVGGYPEHLDFSNNVLLDLAVHDIDILNVLIGNLQFVASTCHNTLKKRVYDTAEILLRSKQGPSAAIHVNWITPTKIRTLRVTGTKGVCSIDYILQTCTVVGGDLSLTRTEPSPSFNELVKAYQNVDRIELGVTRDEPLKLQLAALNNDLREKTTYCCTGEMGASAVSIALKALQYC